MLERIREGAQGPWAMGIIALIVLSFVFAGVGSYLTAPTATAVAKVNGEEISSSDLERAYQNQRAQMESQFGEGLAALFSDPDYLDRFRRQVLDRLVGDVLFQQHANELGLRTSDEQVREVIVNMPEFQLGGQFSNDRYLALIRQAGFQAADFRDYIRREMTREQLAIAVSASAFSLDKQAREIALLEQQTRDAQILTVNADLFNEDLSVSDDEVQAYYDGNLTQFDTEERVNVAYVTLNVSDLEKDVVLEDNAVREFYDENLALYRSEEQRRISHILIEFGDDQDAARAEIDALKARIANGESFSDIAEAESADTFSAENGGDLGFITDDMMGEAFDSAAFALTEVSQVSDVVETEFGFHLLQATEITPQETIPFAQVEEEITATLKRDLALDKFFELQSQMAEIAFEVPESLDEVANLVDKQVQTTGFITRANAPSVVNYPAVLADVFSVELIEEGVNSDVIEIDENRAIVVRVAEHEPQRTKTLDEVKPQITQTLLAQKAQDAASEWANSIIESMHDGQDVTPVLDEKGLKWKEIKSATRNSVDLSPEFSSSLFGLAPGDASNSEVVSLSNGDVGIVKLTAVNASQEVSDDTLAQFKQRLVSQSSQSTISNLIEALKADADVEIML